MNRLATVGKSVFWLSEEVLRLAAAARLSRASQHSTTLLNLRRQLSQSDSRTERSMLQTEIEKTESEVLDLVLGALSQTAQAGLLRFAGERPTAWSLKRMIASALIRTMIVVGIRTILDRTGRGWQRDCTT